MKSPAPARSMPRPQLSEPKTRVFVVDIEQDTDVVVVSQRARQIAASLGFTKWDRTLIGTKVYEAARKVVEHGRQGSAEYWLRGNSALQSFEVRIKHKGSRKRGGTIVREMLPEQTRAITRQDVLEIADCIAEVPPYDALHELNQLNLDQPALLPRVEEEMKTSHKARLSLFQRLGIAASRRTLDPNCAARLANDCLTGLIDFATAEFPALRQHRKLMQPLLNLVTALVAVEDGAVPEMFRLPERCGGRPSGGKSEAMLRAHAAAAVTVLATSKEMSLQQALRFVGGELAKAGIVQPNR